MIVLAKKNTNVLLNLKLHQMLNARKLHNHKIANLMKPEQIRF